MCISLALYRSLLLSNSSTLSFIAANYFRNQQDDVNRKCQIFSRLVCLPFRPCGCILRLAQALITPSPRSRYSYSESAASHSQPVSFNSLHAAGVPSCSLCSIFLLQTNSLHQISELICHSAHHTKFPCKWILLCQKLQSSGVCLSRCMQFANKFSPNRDARMLSVCNSQVTKFIVL